MRYSIACLGAFAITALAAPLESLGNHGHPNKEVKITLSNKREDPGDGSFRSAETLVRADGRQVEARDNNNNDGAGFRYINIEVQGLPQGQEDGDLRCQAIGRDADSLAGMRGENQDVNFSDAGNGPWEFLLGDVNVEAFICDPAFKKISEEELEAGKLTDVVLRPQWGDRRALVAKGFNGLQRQTARFPRGIANRLEFSTVEIKTGKFFTEGVGQELRCQVIGARGKPIIAQRGENIDITFSDKANGQWTFIDEVIEELEGEVVVEDVVEFLPRSRRQAGSPNANGGEQLPAPRWEDVAEAQKPAEEYEMDILGKPIEHDAVTAKVFAIICDPEFVALPQDGGFDMVDPEEDAIVLIE